MTPSTPPLCRNNIIRSVDTSTSETSVFAGSATCSASNGFGTSAGFCNPTDVKLSPSGDTLYVAHSPPSPGIALIRSINISTAAVTTLAGGGAGTSNGIGTNAGFSNVINGLAVSPDGATLYVADTCRIRAIVIATATVRTLAGGTCATFTGRAVDGVGSAAKFKQAWGLVATSDLLYVSDRNAKSLRVIFLSNAYVATLANSTATFGAPAGIALDASESTLFYADASKSVIGALDTTTRLVRIIAGVSGSVGTADGASPRFDAPTGIVVSGSSVFVSDVG